MRSAQKLVLKYIRTKFKILSAISKRKTAEKAFILFCTPQYRNRKKLPKIFLEAELVRFSFHNYHIQGYRWNASSDKKILILHGFESSVVNFDHYVRPLIREDYCVLAFDAPAHGRSSGKVVNVLAYKEFIDHINKKYGPVKNFIAHSFGGLALCLTVEKWKHDDTYKLVLIAPAAETTTAIDSFFDLLQLDKRVRSGFDNIIKENSGYSPEWFSVSRACNHMKAQLLICQDKDDALTPLRDLQGLMNKGFPNIHFYITEGLGHRRIYRDNKVFKVILDFLR